eukprot:3818270-Amphidinium_carterae.3
MVSQRNSRGFYPSPSKGGKFGGGKGSKKGGKPVLNIQDLKDKTRPLGARVPVGPRTRRRQSILHGADDGVVSERGEGDSEHDGVGSTARR